MGKGGAKRHRNQKPTGLTCEQLRRDVSKSRVLEFLYCAGVPSTEWKNDIRLRVGIEYSAQVMDILEDVVKVAASRSTGKNVIVMLKDVLYAFDTKNPNMAAKGRTPIIGEVRRSKKRRGGSDGISSDSDSVRSKRARTEEPEERKEEQPAPIQPAAQEHTFKHA